VVEKSDILVQVVDGRDPLFYRCEDLEKYVLEPAARPYRKDQTKSNFLLVNKSDLMSEEIRKAWNEYFLANKIDHMFFSAKLE
jgi:large subunit GTPase 1